MGSWAGGKFDAEEKNKFYSEYMCHELNLFIKKRDPEYFKTVVIPFLQCKMEKTFVDHYLLGDHATVAKYESKMKSLNAMETCLLIDSLV